MNDSTTKLLQYENQLKHLHVSSSEWVPFDWYQQLSPRFWWQSLPHPGLLGGKLLFHVFLAGLDAEGIMSPKPSTVESFLGF